ncbi:hypothetical protein CYMTET_31305 [Cymbomonas tetramitiformis]|uniref:Uncharacterized protein n=1 Tax=Cymbomonas tetramitiformis TaxID=36881 RepID=A0AAE0KT03_9CHLO|nr:hypothetical protein CYMTET_31305 [Cymbomonas tetramitiformis]
MGFQLHWGVHMKPKIFAGAVGAACLALGYVIFKSRGPKPRRACFVDVVDPDNYAVVAMEALRASRDGYLLDIVVVGRPVNLSLTRFHPDKMKFKTPDGEEVKIDFRQHVKEQSFEADHHVPDHSNLILRARIRNQRLPLKSLEEFNAVWEREPRIEFTVGGPFTPLLALGEKYKKLSEKPGTLVAMACAWKGDENLLKDNFNNQVDIDAAEAVLVEQKVFPNLRRIILTTETCKVGWLTVSAEEIRERTGWGSLADLVGLWNCFQARQAPLFDVAVSLALDRPDAVPFELLPARLTTIADEASLAQRRIEVCELHPTTGCFVHEEHQKRPEAAEGGFAEVYSSTMKYEHSSDAEVDSKSKEQATEAAKSKFLDYLASAYASRRIYRPWWKKVTARL